MSKLDNLLSRLQKVKRTGKTDYIACCPAHQDKSPSMTIREVEPDHILLHCFAGCDVQNILGAVGLDFDDVYPDRARDEVRKPSAIPFNARDVLVCIASDAQLAYLFNCDVIAGKPVTPEECAAVQKALIRIIAATRMGGVQ